MALTKIGATLGGSADVITVTQNSHGLTLGYPVKMTSGGYAHATADTAANAEAIGIIIATTTNTLTIALGGRITVDGCVPNVTAGTVLFLQVSAGLLAATEPSSANQISKPMAVVTVANSEMLMVQQRGEVISTGAATIADGSVTLAKMAVNSIDSDQYVDGSIDSAHIGNDQIDSQHYAAASIDNEHLADNAVDSDELAAGSVDIAHLSASGTKDATTVLHGNNAFAAVSGIPSGAILMWHGLIANIPSGWVLCNGSNSTPDLRGQFVQGAANGVEAGATGGSATATPAAHSNHSVTQPSTHSALGTHQHQLPFGKDSSYNIIYHGNSPTFGTSSNISIGLSDGGTSSGGSTKTVISQLSQAVAAGTPNAHSGTAVDAHSAHSTSDSRPPFYTILYIMKT